MRLFADSKAVPNGGTTTFKNGSAVSGKGREKFSAQCFCRVREIEFLKVRKFYTEAAGNKFSLSYL